MTPMKYDPRTGRLLKGDLSRHATDWRPADADEERRVGDSLEWLFNPWTGQPRDERDIEVDPYGRGMRAPGEPMRTATKESNPKDAIGDTKAPLWLLSPIAKIAWATAQFAGQAKYGSWNFRIAGVRASTYISAIHRHIDAFTSGETFDPVDGTDHLGNIMACCAIILEAREAGKLTDDRPPVISHRAALARAEAQMVVLREKYATKNPRHYTIADKVSSDTLAQPTAEIQYELAASFVRKPGPVADCSRAQDRDPGTEES